MACDKICHGLPTLKNNQKTLRFCKIGLYKKKRKKKKFYFGLRHKANKKYTQKNTYIPYLSDCKPRLKVSRTYNCKT